MEGNHGRSGPSFWHSPSYSSRCRTMPVPRSFTIPERAPSATLSAATPQPSQSPALSDFVRTPLLSVSRISLDAASTHVSSIATTAVAVPK